MARPKGHIRDTARPFGTVHHDHLIGASTTPIPETFSLPARIDNQQCSDCTGSYGLLVETWCAFRGIPCDPISRRFTYTLGREIASPDAPLVDQGANPASVVQGMQSFGVVPESVCPGDDPAIINDPVPFFELEVATTFKVTGVAVIEDEGMTGEEIGANRCAAIRRAIAAGFPVGFGMPVDQSFEDWRGGDAAYDGPTGPSLGGHAVRLVGYRPGAFLLANSWGTGWANAGFCWISDRFIGSAYPFDFYLLNVAPAVHS